MSEKNEAFCAIGQLMFGPRWQTQVAEILKISDRTIRRYVAGDAIPDGVFEDLLAAAAVHREQIGNELAQYGLDLSIAVAISQSAGEKSWGSAGQVAAGILGAAIANARRKIGDEHTAELLDKTLDELRGVK